MIINHNMGAMNANRQMGINATNAGKSMEKLSSGLRINKAGDDAAGLAISEKMRGQIRGLDQASANAQDGISMIQTAEGALSETHSILQRMRELAVQSSNDTNVSVDRSEIQKEMDELAKEVTRISNNTEFNTQKLINGGISDTGVKSAKFHVGANSNQDITLSINAMDAKSLGVSRDVTTTTGTAKGTNASNVKLDSTVGSSVVDKANITLAAADNAGAKATVTTNNDVVFSATDAGATLNGKTITIKQGGSADTTAEASELTIDADGNFTFTIGDDASDASLVTNKDSLITELNSAIAAYDLANSSAKSGLDSVTLKSGATSTDTATVVGTGNLADGAAANAAETIITLSDGTTTQKITVLDTAKSVKVTTGAFNGISFDIKDATTLAAASDSIDIGSKTSSAVATTFASGAKTADAVTEAGIDVSTQTNASAAITTIQSAIETVSGERSKLGAYQNRLEHTIANLGTSSENLTSAESRIRDVNMAKEMSTFSKNNILSQAAQAMLAQANQQPQQVLQLLR